MDPEVVAMLLQSRAGIHDQPAAEDRPRTVPLLVTSGFLGIFDAATDGTILASSRLYFTDENGVFHDKLEKLGSNVEELADATPYRSR